MQIITVDSITEKSIRETSGGLFGIGKFKRFKDFDKSLDIQDFLTSYKDESAHRPKLTTEDYVKIFNHMHKYDFASQNINCGACGYRHCKDMAYAIYYKLNVRENCVYYLKQSMKDQYSELKAKYEDAVRQLQAQNQQ